MFGDGLLVLPTSPIPHCKTVLDLNAEPATKFKGDKEETGRFIIAEEARLQTLCNAIHSMQ
jgi:hypothetical protein